MQCHNENCLSHNDGNQRIGDDDDDDDDDGMMVVLLMMMIIIIISNSNQDDCCNLLKYNKYNNNNDNNNNNNIYIYVNISIISCLATAKPAIYCEGMAGEGEIGGLQSHLGFITS